MRYAHFYAKLFHEPLALDPGMFHALEALLTNAMNGVLPAQVQTPGLDPVQGRKMKPESRQRRAEAHFDPGHGANGRTAVIHVDGVLDRHLAGLDLLCFDGTDTADLELAIAEATRDNGTHNVLLSVNSPGGSVAGIPEVHAAIAQLAREKNVFAFVDGYGCSAAYWIAAGADQILATPSSVLGSIGCYSAYVDQSRRLTDMGIEVNTIQSGDLKTAGAPWKRLTDSERESLQTRVDEIGALFRAEVRAARPSVGDDAMRGQAFYAASALSARLIDGIVKNRDEALAQFP